MLIAACIAAYLAPSVVLWCWLLVKYGVAPCTECYSMTPNAELRGADRRPA